MKSGIKGVCGLVLIFRILEGLVLCLSKWERDRGVRGEATARRTDSQTNSLRYVIP